MFTDKTIRCYHSNVLDSQMRREIRVFLRDEAHNWINKPENKEQGFYAYKLVGKDSTAWSMYPLTELYASLLERYKGNAAKAKAESGRAVGLLLKQALRDDTEYEYALQPGYKMKYTLRKKL